MWITIQLVSGVAHSIEAHPSLDVLGFKQQLVSALALPLERVRLLCNGRLLTEGRPLTHFGLKSGSLLHLVLTRAAKRRARLKRSVLQSYHVQCGQVQLQTAHRVLSSLTPNLDATLALRAEALEFQPLQGNAVLASQDTSVVIYSCAVPDNQSTADVGNGDSVLETVCDKVLPDNQSADVGDGEDTSVVIKVAARAFVPTLPADLGPACGLGLPGNRPANDAGSQGHADHGDFRCSGSFYNLFVLAPAALHSDDSCIDDLLLDAPLHGTFCMGLLLPGL